MSVQSDVPWSRHHSNVHRMAAYNVGQLKNLMQTADINRHSYSFSEANMLQDLEAIVYFISLWEFYIVRQCSKIENNSLFSDHIIFSELLQNFTLKRQREQKLKP